MLQIRKLLTVVALAVLMAGPALAAPTLSAHLPTFSNPTAPVPAAPSSPLRPLVPLAPMAGITVKDTGTIASKWSTRAGNAQGDYGTGVAGAGGKWQAAAAASEDAWQQGVQGAAAKKRYSSNIDAAAQSKFTTNASKLGPARYAQGVQNATGAYQAGVQPYLDTLKGLSLPPRGPKGAPQNYQIAQTVAQALRARKVGS